MKMNRGTPGSMVQAIQNAMSDIKDTKQKDQAAAREIELHIIEFIRNRMNVVACSGDVHYDAMKQLQALIEFQDRSIEERKAA